MKSDKFFRGMTDKHYQLTKFNTMFGSKEESKVAGFFVFSQ